MKLRTDVAGHDSNAGPARLLHDRLDRDLSANAVFQDVRGQLRRGDDQLAALDAPEADRLGASTNGLAGDEDVHVDRDGNRLQGAYSSVARAHRDSGLPKARST